MITADVDLKVIKVEDLRGFCVSEDPAPPIYIQELQGQKYMSLMWAL